MLLLLWQAFNQATWPRSPNSHICYREGKDEKTEALECKAQRAWRTFYIKAVRMWKWQEENVTTRCNPTSSRVTPWRRG